VNLPFTRAQFFAVFREYNLATWPAPLLLTGLALLVVIVAVMWPSAGRRGAFALLALLWLWTGIVYQLGFFAEINPAARAFTVLFGLGAGIFLFRALRPGSRPSPDAATRITAFLLVLYALLFYPVLARVAGHLYPDSASFGTPCPVTIFTLGVLLFEGAPVSAFLAPLVWAVIGGSAALVLGVPEDFGLIAAGLAAVLLLVRRRARRAAAA
jgi:uncharacterized protein DUF6064